MVEIWHSIGNVSFTPASRPSAISNQIALRCHKQTKGVATRCLPMSSTHGTYSWVADSLDYQDASARTLLSRKDGYGRIVVDDGRAKDTPTLGLQAGRRGGARQLTGAFQAVVRPMKEA